MAAKQKKVGQSLSQPYSLHGVVLVGGKEEEGICLPPSVIYKNKGGIIIKKNHS